MGSRSMVAKNDSTISAPNPGDRRSSSSETTRSSTGSDETDETDETDDRPGCIGLCGASEGSAPETMNRPLRAN
jgi:hypothetical protein